MYNSEGIKLMNEEEKKVFKKIFANFFTNYTYRRKLKFDAVFYVDLTNIK